MRVVFVGRRRLVWKVILLYLVTLGIYRRVWLYRLNKEIDGHAALGIPHRLNVVLLVLPVLGPTIVTYQTTARLNHDLRTDLPLRYGKTGWLWLLTWVPILGNAFYIGWTQDRLNRYWAQERDNTEHGVDIDAGLAKDERFLVELRKAQKLSQAPGSRFDRRRAERRQRWAVRATALRDIRAERARVRAVGGSTPVMPWRRPRRPNARMLHVTCGRCDTRFEVRQDPFAETPLLCPKCGMSDVLPALRDDPLARPQRAAVPALKATCPKCKAKFHAVRDLHGPTDLRCPECGHQETLPAPTPKKGRARARAKKA